MEEYEALGGEVAESEVGEDDFGGVEEVEGAAVVAAEEEGLGLHVDVGGVGGEGGHLVGEEDGGGVEDWLVLRRRRRLWRTISCGGGGCCGGACWALRAGPGCKWAWALA